MPVHRGNKLTYLSAKDAYDLRKSHAVSEFRTIYGIIEDLEKRIHMSASTGSYDILYNIPLYMPNLPIYNAVELRPHVMDHFRRHGYKVLPINQHGIPQTAFYVSWVQPCNNTNKPNQKNTRKRENK